MFPLLSVVLLMFVGGRVNWRMQEGSEDATLHIRLRLVGDSENDVDYLSRAIALLVHTNMPNYNGPAVKLYLAAKKWPIVKTDSGLITNATLNETLLPTIGQESNYDFTVILKPYDFKGDVNLHGPGGGCGGVPGYWTLDQKTVFELTAVDGKQEMAVDGKQEMAHMLYSMVLLAFQPDSIDTCEEGAEDKAVVTSCLYEKWEEFHRSDKASCLRREPDNVAQF